MLNTADTLIVDPNQQHATMGSLRSAFDVLVIIFFLTHIPITMLVDSQALFPRSMYPSSATKMMDDFLRDFGDPLVRRPAPRSAASVLATLSLVVPFLLASLALTSSGLCCR